MALVEGCGNRDGEQMIGTQQPVFHPAGMRGKKVGLFQLRGLWLALGGGGI